MDRSSASPSPPGITGLFVIWGYPYFRKHPYWYAYHVILFWIAVMLLPWRESHQSGYVKTSRSLRRISGASIFFRCEDDHPREGFDQSELNLQWVKCPAPHSGNLTYAIEHRRWKTDCKSYIYIIICIYIYKCRSCSSTFHSYLKWSESISCFFFP